MKQYKYILGIIFFISTLGCSSSDSDSNSSASLPTITTTEVSNISGLNATLKGNISSTGNSEITKYGFCWSKIPNPTLASFNAVEYNTILGDFTLNIVVNEPNINYYVRAFAENSKGISYGNQITFTSGNVVTSILPTDILTKSVKFRMLVVPSPNLFISEIGYCVNTAPNPTLSNSVYANNGVDGNITYNASGFQPNTVYYAKSYYKSGGDYFFGEEISFKTCGYFGVSGGYVFYDKGDYENGWRYMELAPESIDYNNTAIGADWGCNSVFLSFTYPNLGKGLENTQHIISTCFAANCAAKLCDNYTINGLSDWFLPSSEELVTIHKSLKREGFINSSYDYIWSSTEFDTTNAYQVWFINATTPDVVKEPKSYNAVVAPVRRF